MNRLLKWLEKILPRYAWLPIIGMFAFNALTYWGTRLINLGMDHVEIVTALDRKIPFVPEAISVYILAYVTWAFSYILIARESRQACYRVALGNCLAKVLCMVCFIAMPTTTFLRPDASGSGLWLWLVRIIYALDPPNNLFPSIHCLENWIGWRGMFGCKSIPRWAKACSFISAILVFASTVLVRQHYLLDIPSGMLAAEIGLAASGLLLPALAKARARRKG